MNLSKIDKNEIVQQTVKLLAQRSEEFDLSLAAIDKDAFVEKIANTATEHILSNEYAAEKFEINKESISEEERAQIKEMMLAVVENALFEGE